MKATHRRRRIFADTPPIIVTLASTHGTVKRKIAIDSILFSVRLIALEIETCNVFYVSSDFMCGLILDRAMGLRVYQFAIIVTQKGFHDND